MAVIKSGLGASILTILLALCQQQLICSAARIEIRPNLSPVYFELGSANKVLTCTALGDQPNLFTELRWAGPNRSDNWDELNKKHRVRETKRKGYAVELEFQRPTLEDSGTYFCYGKYQNTDSYNASVNVQIYKPIKLENCLDRQFVIEGAASQKITCRISGDAISSVFFKDEMQIDPSNPRYHWDNNNDNLDIQGQATKADAGIYRIEITSDLTGDREKKEILVEVHSKPEFPVGAISEFSSVEGEQAELKCDVTGNPKPLVYWRDPRLQRNVSSVGGYYVNPETGTLLISKVNRLDDHGEFTCVAVNNVGEATRKINMVAMQRPSIVAFENKTFEEGTEAFLECRATGYPKPTFSIRKHGLNQMPYYIGDGYVSDIAEDLEGGSAPGYIYRVKLRAHRNLYGLHYCNVTNKAGSAERVGSLVVKYRPDLGRTPTVQSVKLGQNVTLTCHVQAYPPPTISWFNEMGQQILNSPGNSTSSPDGQTHIVTMMPSGIVQAGTNRYRCRANNGIGEPQEIVIQTRYKTTPRMINAVVMESTPTTVKLSLNVADDGGDRILAYKYRAEGRTLNQFAPFANYPIDRQNETSIEALPTTSGIYTIRNLLPYYRYTLIIKAVNDVGDGDVTEISVDTRKPTRPEPPIIIKPTMGSSSSQVGFTSEYQNGYLLKWSPPDLDNGDPVIRYIIKLFRVSPEMPDTALATEEPRIIEQTNERPLHARVGPLEPNQYYRIQLQARNLYGESDPASIIINTAANRPLMPDFSPQALTWLTEPSTSLLIGLLVLGLIFLIIIDVIFCVCFQIGVSYSLRNCCCPSKANSVISDKTYT